MSVCTTKLIERKYKDDLKFIVKSCECVNSNFLSRRGHNGYVQHIPTFQLV